MVVSEMVVAIELVVMVVEVEVGAEMVEEEANKKTEIEFR